MSAKLSLVVCAQALFIQCIASQCINAYDAYGRGAEAWAVGPYGAPLNAPLAAAPYAGYNPASLAASNGGGLAITSSSPIAPNGVTMLSENAIEGPLAVGGQIPFLGAVALEGILPTAGAGGVAYGCGNGNVAMLAEDLSGYGLSAGYMGPGYGPAGPLRYNGCGAVY